MVSFLRFRCRGTFLLVIIGVVLCVFISFTSGALRPRKIGLPVGKPYDYGHDNSYYYNRENYYPESYTRDRESDSDDKWYKKSSSSTAPPTTDDDFNQSIEHRRGAMDRKGRAIIFKSLILAPLAMVLLILLLVLLVPIPVLSSPLPGRRSLDSSYSSSSILRSTSVYTLKMAREVLTSEECIERISCELSRISRSHDSTSWIPSTLEKLLIKSKWSERIIRGMKGISPSACSQFTCTPAKNLKRTLKSAANTVAQ